MRLGPDQLWVRAATVLGQREIRWETTTVEVGKA